jgi:GT2 family glycosyltransferase
MPVLDEAAHLPRLLDQLREQTPPQGGFEVLVVDGGSTDGTRELVRERARSWFALTLLDNPARRSAAGRNVGARAAAGEFVLFLDGHCTLAGPEVLLRVVSLFEETGAECLARPQPLAAPDGSAWARAIAAARHSPLGHKPGSEIYTATAGYVDPHSAGAAYRREVLRRLGGYDERFDACEDVEFNHRVKEAGYRTYIHPDLAVRYAARSTLPALCRQMFRYGRGRAHLMARHPEAAPRPLLAATGAMLPVAALPGVMGAGLGVALVSGAALVAAAVLWLEGLRISRSPLQAARIAAALAVIPLGLEAGFLRGLLEFPRFRHVRDESLRPLRKPAP